MDGEREPLLHTRLSPTGSHSASASDTHSHAGRRRPISVSSGRRTQLACGAVLLTEVLERIAFYGLVGNLVLFLNQDPLRWPSYDATKALFFLTGFLYMTAIFGGWLADSFLGRFKSILIFLCIYIIAYVVWPLLHPVTELGKKDVLPKPPGWCYSAHNNSAKSFITNGSQAADATVHQVTLGPELPMPTGQPCVVAVYLSLAFMGVGIGGVKANIAPFGADQVKNQGPVVTRMFFNWFYWCVNIGALLSFGLIAYIQQEYTFFYGFLIPNICLALAAVVFLCGRCVYTTKPASGSVITNILKILWEACRLRRRASRRNSSILHSTESLDRASRPRCLDFAKVRYGGSFHDNMVDDVKTLFKITCIFLSLVPYWVVYLQMETTFVIQGLHMRLSPQRTNSSDPSPNAFKIPVAWLSLFDVIFLVLLIPLLDRVIYPRLDKKGIMMTLRTRILIGMVFSVIAVIVAGFVEMHRLDVYWKNGTAHYIHQIIGNTTYYAADVTILMQIPQYALIGISEVFASVAGLELAYTEAPRSMQGIIMGLFWFMQGVGSFLGTVIMSAFEGVWFFAWDYGDINCRNVSCSNSGDGSSKLCDCHLDYYFFVLAGVQVVGIVLFLAIAYASGIGGVAASSKRYPGIAGNSSEGPAPAPSANSSRPAGNNAGDYSRQIQRRPRLSTASSLESDVTR